MRWLIVVTLAMLFCNVVSAQEFTFVLCEETGRHFSVQKERDYYLAHFHLRVKNHAGKPFFGRVRMQYQDDRQGAGVVTTLESSSVVTAGTDNDLWSMFFRVPALEAAFAGGVQLVCVRVDYSENMRVLVDELRDAAMLPADGLPAGERL